ncbi:MAG TPA: class I SAM-dependent methyltransferase [Stellaceae bacterium]|nr:class I SAM-dependent methyltransferase [Stellaceae bacterium]
MIVSPASGFWKYFDEEAAPHLSFRADGFRQIFAHLDRLERPPGIVETGCMRKNSDWGDGRSTLLWAKYAQYHPGCVVYSVDLDPQAVGLCRSMTEDWVQLHCGDSVRFLKSLADRPPPNLAAIDLLYLDSFDVDFANPLPSAIHHLKELAAIAPLLSAETLVVVDDSPMSVLAVPQAAGELRLMSQPRIGGKGLLIAEYAAQIGAQRVLSGYQMGWTGLGRPAN